MWKTEGELWTPAQLQVLWVASHSMQAGPWHAAHAAPASSSSAARPPSAGTCVCAAAQAKRDEFWGTAPFYGGSQEIWQALKAACSADDLDTTKLILDAAGVIVSSSDLSVCYDERGFKYELPNYVFAAPSNLGAT